MQIHTQALTQYWENILYAVISFQTYYVHKNGIDGRMDHLKTESLMLWLLLTLGENESRRKIKPERREDAN